MSEWRTAYADVDIRYGAIFVRDEGHYAEVIEVTDLDGATGTRGMVLIESGNVSIEYAGNFADQRARLASALASCGPESLRGLDHAAGRLVAYSALWTYGYRDIDTSAVLAEQDAEDADGGSWHDLVDSEYPIESDDDVWRYLSDQFGIERPERAS